MTYFSNMTIFNFLADTYGVPEARASILRHPLPARLVELLSRSEDR
jgi:hypothetical protein